MGTRRGIPAGRAGRDTDHPSRRFLSSFRLSHCAPAALELLPERREGAGRRPQASGEPLSGSAAASPGAVGPRAGGPSIEVRSVDDASAVGRPGFACTCFASSDLDGHRFMGRNFDRNRDPDLVLLRCPAHGPASMALVDIHYLGFIRLLLDRAGTLELALGRSRQRTLTWSFGR